MKPIHHMAGPYRAICVLALAALPVVASQVDTLVSSSAGSGCTTVSLQGTVSASLPINVCQFSDVVFGAGASAFASFLSLGTSASGFWHSQVTTGGQVSAAATAQSADVITVGGGNLGDPAFLEFQFEISGNNLATLIGPTLQIGTSVGGSFTNLIACDFDPNLLPIAIGCPAAAPDAVLNFPGVSYLNTPVGVEIPVRFGVPVGIFFELFSTADAVIDPNFVVNFDGSSDFFNTAKIMSVSVLDGNHQPVSGAALVAESGTVYPVAGAVPEPSAGALLLIGVTVMFAYKWRYSRSHP